MFVPETKHFYKAKQSNIIRSYHDRLEHKVQLL